LVGEDHNAVTVGVEATENKRNTGVHPERKKRGEEEEKQEG
jgi:hypothetical protein